MFGLMCAGVQAGGGEQGSDGYYALWTKRLRELGKAEESVQVAEVNRFINSLRRRSDVAVWGREDYWATPREFLDAGAGDCEDFAIAKYYSLRALGVPDHRLQLAHVRRFDAANGRFEAHIVLHYLPTENAEPLVLDNLDTEIRTAASRRDLLPQMGFNASHVWRLERNGQRNEQGYAMKVPRWRKLLARLEPFTSVPLS